MRSPFRLAIALITLTLAVTASAFWFIGQPKIAQITAQPVPPAPSITPTKSQTLVPDGWQKIDTEGRFTLYLPPDMKQHGDIGIESYYRSYANSKMKVSFDYEPYDGLAYHCRRPAQAKEYQEEVIEIGGRKATFVAYHLIEKRRMYNAGLFVGDWAKAKVKLDMWVTGKSPDTVETARRIFSTVEIP